MVVGQHPDVFSVGTMQGFPDNGQFDEDNICSCGIKALECPFWSKVLQDVEATPSGPDKERALFQGIHLHSGCKVIVDVAHGVSRLPQLAGAKGIDLKVLYTLRPRRGVIFSNIRKGRERNEFVRAWRDPMERSLRIGRSWSLNQRMAQDYCRAKSIPFLVIHYDELCRDPQKILNIVGHHIGLDYSGIGDRLTEGQPMRCPAHLIRGNRKLRSRNDIRLRRDESYLEQKTLIPRLLGGLGSLEARMEHFALGWRRLRKMKGED